MPLLASQPSVSAGQREAVDGRFMVRDAVAQGTYGQGPASTTW